MNYAGAKRAAAPQQLTSRDAKHFLTNYKKAWETRDPELAASLFTRDAEYKTNPFSPAIRGREAIHDYWAGATGRQAEIRFNVASFIQCGFSLAAEWTCTYQDQSSGEKRELAGMLLADFYGTQVRRFREYWHSRPAGIRDDQASQAFPRTDSGIGGLR
jgi:nuclear transport factor 2 (NTF2) superfamily protein